jgi:hypothetical protein
MAYDLRHTGAEIDEAISAVESGSVVTDNTVSSIALGEDKPASADAIAKELQKKVDKVTGKGLSTNDYTNEEKEQVAKIGGKQDTLSLTVKDNGNIVLGNIAGQTKEFMPATPSGDPMHYAYIDAGATWSSSTGYWSLNGLTDITNEQMRKIYNFGFLKIVKEYAMSALRAKIRTNLLRIGGDNITGNNNVDMTGFALNNNVIEVLTLKNTTGSYESYIMVTSLSEAFKGCSALQKIYGIIECSTITSITKAFVGCVALQRLRISALKKDISLSDSPLLDKESLLFIIQKANQTSAITITLHAEAYARLANDADVLAALAAQPNITLISA